MSNRKRYFQEISSKEKYPVGQLSPELRKALHLEDDMLPFWIYKMRVLGYPPAWMKEAEMSTLELIDTAGPSANNPFVGTEEGEIKDTTQQYNRSSLIEFPGFNAPIPPNVKDDWLILGMPPLIMKQQLSEAVKTMKLIEPVPYKKSKLDVSCISDKTSTDDNTPDFRAYASADSDVILLNDDSTAASNTSTKDLTSNGLNSSANGIDDSLKTEDADCTSSNLDSSDEASSASSGAVERKLKEISMGAPMPPSVKPNKPPLQNWAVGMGELMHFENLPTSTGAYKNKMKGVLSKVRNRFTKEDEAREEGET